jgi:tetratricopeptide (TPR) repeat protein
VLILDCCYGGAFPAGGAKGDNDVHSLDRFRGRGRVVLTACDATQYAFEGDQAHGQPEQSVFTRYLVEGLRDGSADLDGDGDITIDELYTYVHDRVIDVAPHQRPKRQDNVEGRIVIARNVNWVLPLYLRHALDSPIYTARLTALDGLTQLFRIGNEQVRAQTLAAIRQLSVDDSRSVSAAASEYLRALVPGSATREPQQSADAEMPRAGQWETVLHRAEDLVGQSKPATHALHLLTDDALLDDVTSDTGTASASAVLEGQRHAEAEAAYREAVRLDPFYAGAHNGLGNVLVSLRRYAEAEAAYREAVRLDPSYAGAHNGLGNALLELKRYAGAEAAYREAVRLDPANAIMRRNLANVLVSLEQYPEAEEVAREATGLDPGYAWAHSTLGSALRVLRRYAEAEAAYREAVRLDPVYAWARNGLGDVLYDLERYAEAEAAYRNAVRLDPANAIMRRNLGNAQASLKL